MLLSVATICDGNKHSKHGLEDEASQPLCRDTMLGTTSKYTRAKALMSINCLVRFILKLEARKIVVAVSMTFSS